MCEVKTGERIALLRVSRGESQQNVADKVGVSREAVKFWESGNRQIKAVDLVKLARHFDVSADYLLGLTDTPTVDTDLRAVCEYTGLTESAVLRCAKFKEFPPLAEALCDFIDHDDFCSFVGNLCAFREDLCAEKIFDTLLRINGLRDSGYDVFDVDRTEKIESVKKCIAAVNNSDVPRQVSIELGNLLDLYLEPRDSDLALALAVYGLEKSEIARYQISRYVNEIIRKFESQAFDLQLEALSHMRAELEVEHGKEQ